MAAAGVNFIDVYQHEGWYKINLPAIPGGEGAGVVEAVGAGVTKTKPGDRVAWMGGLGCYATHCLVPRIGWWCSPPRSASSKARPRSSRG